MTTGNSFFLVFALMSRKTEKYYAAVLRAILVRLQDTQVEEFMVDFEVAKCHSMKPIIILSKWNQCFKKKTTTVLYYIFAYMFMFVLFYRCRESKSLSVSRCDHQRLCFSLDTICVEASTKSSRECIMYSYIRQLLVLSFLPSLNITDTFHYLKARANSPQFRTMWKHGQWFRNQVFKVYDWCVFQRTIRTNNDVQGNN